MKIIVPAYFYPGPTWDTLLSNPGPISDVIINPASGPGNEGDTEYVRVVRGCKKKGIGVLGYVATTWGGKSLEATKIEIARFFDWYSVSGIFLDETSTKPEDIPYYRQLYDFIDGKVVLNPGTVPHEYYVSVGDVVIIFESDAAKHAAVKFPDWLRKYRAQTCQIVTTCGSRDKMKKAIKKAAAISGAVYVTDDVEPNPYDVLPSYWKDELNECLRY